jgi:Domain of unknown function (DUF4190)
VSDAPPEAPSPPDADDLPYLPDPYYVAPPPSPPAPPPARPAPSPRAGLSKLALSSLLSAVLLGPVGAILAILFGWYARREIERAGTRRSGYELATVGLVLGSLLTPVWGGVLSYLAWMRVYRTPPASIADARPAPSPIAVPPGRVPQGPVGPVPLAPNAAAPTVPRRTHVAREGGITVVDLGTATASLSEELARQRAEAAASGETVVVMTTAGRCDPCRGVDRALPDPRMQTALHKVRLLRVDVEIFQEDLEALRMPADRIPGFFLPAPDLTPRDGIDGGEWDEDIAANIARVLGPFVRGKYLERREPWRPVPGSGVTL